MTGLCEQVLANILGDVWCPNHAASESLFYVCVCEFTLKIQQYSTLCSLWQQLSPTLTNHEGGVSLKGIKRTLPLSLLLFSLQPQLSISKRLSETKRARQERKSCWSRGRSQKLRIQCCCILTRQTCICTDTRSSVEKDIRVFVPIPNMNHIAIVVHHQLKSTLCLLLCAHLNKWGCLAPQVYIGPIQHPVVKQWGIFPLALLPK